MKTAPAAAPQEKSPAFQGPYRLVHKISGQAVEKGVYSFPGHEAFDTFYGLPKFYANIKLNNIGMLST